MIKPEGITPCPNRLLKFEQMWLRDGGFSVTANAVWGLSSRNATMLQIASKIKACGEKLLDWSHRSFGSIKKRLEIKGRMLTKAEIDAAKRNLDYDVVKVLRAEVNDILDKENQMWQQCSRALFLKCGDYNTSYFHSKASHRFQRN